MPKGKRAGEPKGRKQTGPKKHEETDIETPTERREKAAASFEAPVKLESGSDEWWVRFHQDYTAWDAITDRVNATKATVRTLEGERKQYEEGCKAKLGANVVSRFKKTRQSNTPEGERAIMEDILESLAVMRDRGHNVPTLESDLFVTDRSPDAERAFRNGKRQAMEGKPNANPHDPTVPQFKKYNEGFDCGAAIYDKEIIQKMMKAAETKPLLGRESSSSH
jgi:hypothetical protein